MQQAQTNTLGELVTTLEQQRTVREDLIVPSDKLKYENGNLYTMAGGQLYDYKMSDLAHDQMGSKLEIPRAYYSKMQVEYPELLEKNVNMWLSKKEKTKFMLRTFNYGAEGIDNICRAILSNRYNIMDNYDVLICALEAVKKSGINVKIEKAQLQIKECICI